MAASVPQPITSHLTALELGAGDEARISGAVKMTRQFIFTRHVLYFTLGSNLHTPADRLASRWTAMQRVKLTVIRLHSSTIHPMSMKK